MTRRLLILSLLGLLTACGFHLRGSVTLPEVMARTHIAGVDRYGALAREVEASLTAGGAQRVETAAEATARLVISREGAERRVLSVDASGKVSEYELYYQLVFSLYSAEGKTLLVDESVSLSRDFAFDADNVLGKGEEEELLRGELMRGAVRQMFQRLRRVGQGG